VVGRIIADLLADREDESAVAWVCQDAVHAGLLDPGRLAGLVAPHAAAYGAADAANLAARLLGTAVTSGADSGPADGGEEA
jgi:hypothetical protein